MASNWDLLEKAIRGGKTEEALRLMRNCSELSTAQHNSVASFLGMTLNRLAAIDETELEKLFRERYLQLAKSWIETTPGAKESAERIASFLESPGSKITITEEQDRYVLTLDPCRSGGRMRRGLTVATSPIAVSMGTTSKAYPWCWGRKGVAYFCIHDCVFLEIIPIELRGYPIGVVQYPEKAEDPCVLLFYKRPELIPEEFFLRVGKSKTIK